MLTQDELLETPDYLLTKYQNEIFRVLQEYMKSNQLSQKDVAKNLALVMPTSAQVLNGNFQFLLLKKLMELGLAYTGRFSKIEFVDKSGFQATKKEKRSIPIIPVVGKNNKLN